MSILNTTKDTIRATIRSIWQGHRPDADDTIYSDLWLYSRITAELVWRLMQTIDRGINAVFPTTSFGVYLGYWLNWIGAPDGSGGYGRIVARGSSATDALRVTCTAGTPTVNQTHFLTDAAGRTYKPDESYAFPGPGTYDFDCAAVDTGAATNLESGDTLTFTSPPAGITAAAVLQKDLDGGADRETDAEGRARLLSLLRSPPASGNVASWVSTIEAVSPGALKAYVWPQRQSYPYGYGMTDYCALQTLESGSDRHIASSDDLYDDIDTAIDDNMPVLSYRNSRQLTMSGTDVDVDISITLGLAAADDQKCDWDAQGNKTTVSTNDATGGTIVASGNITSPTITNGLAAGDRLVINGWEGTCSSVTNGTTFEVNDWPDEWAAYGGGGANNLAGLNITSGGGFIGRRDTTINSVLQEGYGIVEAIRKYMDGLGPNVSYNGAQSEIPGWDSTARIQRLESECFVVGEGNIVSVTVDDLGGGVVDLAHGNESGATASIYDVDEITIWQVYV